MKPLRATCLAAFFSAMLFHANEGRAIVFDETLTNGPGIGGFSRPFDVSNTFENAPTPFTDGILTVEAFGDINGFGESVLVFAETSSGDFLGELFNFPTVQEEPISLTDSIIIPQALLAGYAADGSISFAMVVPPENGASTVRIDSVRLQFQYNVPEPGTLGLLGISCAGLVCVRLRRYQRSRVRNQGESARPRRRSQRDNSPNKA